MYTSIFEIVPLICFYFVILETNVELTGTPYEWLQDMNSYKFHAIKKALDSGKGTKSIYLFGYS